MDQVDSTNTLLQTLLAGGVITAIAGLIGVLVAQHRTTKRHVQGLLEARKVEANRSQEAALQSYLEQMGKLIADPTRPLQSATPGDALSALARAQTLSFIEGLSNPLVAALGKDVQYSNHVRGGILLRFLCEAGLINKDKPVLALHGVKLAEIIWLYAPLSDTDLRGIDLSGAVLGGADLNGADLTRAKLTGAHLTNVDLRDADLSEADLTGADLSFADLRGASFGQADPDTPKFIQRQRSEIKWSNMSDSVLVRAKLRGTDLGVTILDGADLTDTDLCGADLRKAVGLKLAQVDQAKTDEETQLLVDVVEDQRSRASKSLREDTQEGPNIE